MSIFKFLIKSRALLAHNQSSLVSSTFLRTLTSSSQNNNNNEQLSTLFEEAVGLRTPAGDIEIGSGNNELQKKLLELEREVIKLKETENLEKREKKLTTRVEKSVKKVEKPAKPAKPKSLYAVFTGDGGKSVEDGTRSNKKEEIRVFKDLSPETEVFVKLLYREGYFSKANFLVGSKLDMCWFDNSYARNFTKFAAENFGNDHQEIATWLSGSDLKKVALFGCPSITKSDVFAAKRLRKYFAIHEETVCWKCNLRGSCKYKNQLIWKGDTDILNLGKVMRIIMLYALGLVPQQLQVADDVYVSVNRLLMEATNLSITTSNKQHSQHILDSSE